MNRFAVQFNGCDFVHRLQSNEEHMNILLLKNSSKIFELSILNKNLSFVVRYAGGCCSSMINCYKTD